MKKQFKRIAKQCAAVMLGAALVLGAGDLSAFRGINVYAAGTDEASATAVTASDTKWTSGFYKVSGNVTLSNRVNVSGTVTLILEKGCKLTASKGIEVIEGNSLTIKGEGELEATGGNYQAGIGGSGTGKSNSGTIIIENGTIIAKGGQFAAGIGGGASSAAGGDGGTIIIKGGTVNATGGNSASGIGSGTYSGSSGSGGSGGNITIENGTVIAEGGNSGAGIGGASHSSSGIINITGGTVKAIGGYQGAGIGGGTLGSGDTITISGGTVEAIGNGCGAGIGGGNKGSGGSIAIEGGIVTATGGSSGKSAGIGDGFGGSGGTFSTGDSGSAFIVTSGGKSSSGQGAGIGDTSSQGSWSGAIISNNAGQVYGDSCTVTEDAAIPSGATLTIPEGVSLLVQSPLTVSEGAKIINDGGLIIRGELAVSGSVTNSGFLTVGKGGALTGADGCLTGDGSFQTSIVTENMIVVDPVPVYNGQDQSDNINGKLKLQILGHDFTIQGWNEPKVSSTDNFNYTVTYTPTIGEAVTKPVTLLKSGATLTATSNKTEYAYSDTITINATVKPSGTAANAPVKATSRLRGFAAPTAGQIAVYDGDKQISDPQTPDADGACSFTIPAKDLGAGEHTLTVKYIESDVMAQVELNVNVKVEECPHTSIADGKCTDCGETIVATVEIGSVTTNYTDITSAWNAAQGKTATVTLIADQTIGEELTVSNGTNIVLNGNHTLTCTSSNCINVTGGTVNIESGTYNGETCGLYVSGGNVTLSGGTFNDIKTSGGKYLDSLLADGYAYKMDDTVWIPGIYVNTCTAFSEYLTSSYTKAEVLELPIKSAKVTPQTAEVTYGYTADNAPVLTVTTAATGTPTYRWWELKEDGSVKSEISGATTETLTVPTGLSVGKHIFGCIVSLDGFNQLSTSATVTVQPKPLTITGAALDPKTYDGEKTATVSGVTFDGYVNGDSALSASDYTATAAFADANAGTNKTATVTVTLADTVKNYTLAQSTYALANQSINKANVTLTFSNQTITYGETPAPAAAVPAAAEITYSYVSDSGTVSGLPENAGTYTVTATVTETDNYSGATATSTLTINKADYPANKPGSTMSVPNSCGKVGSAALPEGWTWSDADKDTALTVGTALTATACYTAADKDNYNNLTVTITITRSDCDHLNTEIQNAVAATCTEGGYTGDTVCSKCGETVQSGTATAPTGHSGGTATCVKRAVCGKCRTEYGEPDTSKHGATELRGTVAATCTKAGYTGDTHCADCGEKLSEGTATPLAAHTEKSVITKPATYTEEGTKTITCSVCNTLIREETIPKKTKPSGGGSSRPSGGGSSGSHVPSGADDTEKPYIKGDNSSLGWLAIREEADAADEGSKITVEMNGTAEVPGFILNSIKGKDITIVFDMGEGVSWSVNGKDVTEVTGAVDFGVKVGSSDIPVDVINNVTGEKYSMQLSLNYDGEFGFKAVLSVDLGTKSAGCYASLYYYNEHSGEPEFISESRITENGTANLEFTHASDYIVVVNERSRFDEGDTGDSSDSSDSSVTSGDSSGTPVSSTDSGESSENSASSGDSSASGIDSGDSSGSSAASGSNSESDPDENPHTGTNIPYIAFPIAAAGIVGLFVTARRKKNRGR